MRRVLVRAWGADGAQYVGKSMTLFLDDQVRFGGAAVGGIRISHLSHIENSITMALTATRATKKAYTVQAMAAPVATTPRRRTNPRISSAPETRRRLMASRCIRPGWRI